MAIVRETSGAWTGLSVASSGTLSPGYPTGIVANNVLTLVVVTDTATTMLTPSGWTQQSTVVGSTRTLSFYTKVAAGTESGTLTITNAAVAQACGARIIRWSGVDTTTPMDATPVTGTYSNTLGPTSPSITTVSANAMLVGYIVVNTVLTVNSSVWTNVAGVGASTTVEGADGNLSQVAAGASGTKAWTLSAKSAGATMTAALRPATAAVAAGLPPSSRHTTYPTITSGGIYS